MPPRSAHGRETYAGAENTVLALGEVYRPTTTLTLLETSAAT